MMYLLTLKGWLETTDRDVEVYDVLDEVDALAEDTLQPA